MKRYLSVIALIILCCIVASGCKNSANIDNLQNKNDAPFTDLFEYSVYDSYNGAEYKIFDGTLYGRGMNYDEFFGDDEFYKEWVKLADDAVHLEATNGVVMYLASDGNVYGMGAAQGGVLQTDVNDALTEPVLLFEDCKYFSLGARFAIAIKNDNSLWFWGESRNGQGTRVEDAIFEPVKIADKVKTAKAFFYNSFWIDENDNLYICGDNSYGQLGNGQDNNANPLYFNHNVEEPYLALKNCSEFSASKDCNIVSAKTKDGKEFIWGELHGGTPTIKSEALPEKLVNFNVSSGVIRQSSVGEIKAKDGKTIFYNEFIDEYPFNVPAIYKTTFDKPNERKLVKSGLRGEMFMIGESIVVSSECDDCVYLVSFNIGENGEATDINTHLLYDKYAVPVYVKDSNTIVLASPNETRELVLNTKTGEAELGDALAETKFDNKLLCSRNDAERIAIKEIDGGKVENAQLIYKPDFITASLSSKITEARSSTPIDWCWQITLTSNSGSNTNIMINADTKEIIMVS